MPELPEVQTVVSDLNKKIKGEIIASFWSDWPSAIKNATLAKFKKAIKNSKILGARRIGKNIFIDLTGEKTLYIHLKMTGHLLIKSKVESRKLKVNTADHFQDRVNQYIHHIWQFKSGKRLEFSDLRKFAKIILVKTKEVEDLPEIKALGIDALDPHFTLAKFREILSRKPKALVGVLLMDQTLIAGIGNIYRSEILFLAGVLPTRKVGNLSKEEEKKIFLATKKILKKAVELRGTSDSDYRDTDGAPGGFQKILRVYRKAGEKCEKCDRMIESDKLAQRSVFFCPKCQK